MLCTAWEPGIVPGPPYRRLRFRTCVHRQDLSQREMTHQRKFLTLLLVGLLHASDAAAEPVHGIAMHGAPKHAPGFKHFPYVDPDAPKGGRVVLGALKVDPHALQLDNLETELEVDGTVVETGNTSAILGHPANGIAWLANRIADFGLTLDVGHVVLPGTCTRCVRIGGHRRVAGRIDGLGEVTLHLTGSPAVQNNSRVHGS